MIQPATIAAVIQEARLDRDTQLRDAHGREVWTAAEIYEQVRESGAEAWLCFYWRKRPDGLREIGGIASGRDLGVLLIELPEHE